MRKRRNAEGRRRTESYGVLLATRADDERGVVGVGAGYELIRMEACHACDSAILRMKDDINTRGIDMYLHKGPSLCFPPLGAEISMRSAPCRSGPRNEKSDGRESSSKRGKSELTNRCSIRLDGR